MVLQFATTSNSGTGKSPAATIGHSAILISILLCRRVMSPQLSLSLNDHFQGPGLGSASKGVIGIGDLIEFETMGY